MGVDMEAAAVFETAMAHNIATAAVLVASDNLISLAKTDTDAVTRNWSLALCAALQAVLNGAVRK